MKLPKKLWVGNYEYDLQTVPRVHPDLAGDNGVSLLDDENRRILIAKNLKLRHRLEVVLHEIIHVINDAANMDDPLPNEEEMTTKQGHGWTYFLLDNPLFEAWLWATLAEIRKSQKEVKA